MIDFLFRRYLPKISIGRVYFLMFVGLDFKLRKIRLGGTLSLSKYLYIGGENEKSEKPETNEISMQICISVITSFSQTFHAISIFSLLRIFTFEVASSSKNNKGNTFINLCNPVVWDATF